MRLQLDGEVSIEGLGQPSNKSCVFRNNEPNLLTFYEDQQITQDVVEFPPSTELVRAVHFFITFLSKPVMKNVYSIRFPAALILANLPLLVPFAAVAVEVIGPE